MPEAERRTASASVVSSVRQDVQPSTLFSSQIEVRWNAHIPPFFAYGSFPFARTHGLEGLPSRVKARYIRQEFSKDVPPTNKGELRYYWVSGIPDEDVVYAFRKIGGQNAVVALSGLSVGNPTVSFNRLYETWTSLRFVKYERPAELLASLLEVALLQRGIVPIHAGSISEGERAHLFLAPPDTGKSRSVVEFMKRGLGFVAEDIVLASGAEVFPVPFTTTLTQRDTVNLLKRSLRLVFNGVADLKTVFEVLNIPYQPPRPSYQLGNLYILTRSTKTRITQLKFGSQLSRQVLMWNRMEFAYFRDKFLAAYLTLNAKLPSLDWFMDQEREGLDRVLGNAGAIFHIEVQEPSNFPQLIQQTLS